MKIIYQNNKKMFDLKKLVLALYIEIMLLLLAKLVFTLYFKDGYVEPFIYYIYVYLVIKAIRYH